MLDTTGTHYDRGLSSVIASVLVITVTVLLAAVLGTSLLGPATSALENPAPQAGLSIDVAAETNEIVIQHQGGDVVDAAATRLNVEVDGTEATFDPPAGSRVLAVSGQAVITTDSGATTDDTVDWDGDGSTEAYQPRTGSDVLPPIQPGDTVTVQLVDVEAGVIFYEASVTA